MEVALGLGRIRLLVVAQWLSIEDHFAFSFCDS